MRPPPEPVHDILVVDDNPADVRLIREAFACGPARVQVHTASDGIEAHEFLFRRGACAAACSPRLVLLDLNMPRKDGCELLAEVRQDARLRRQPVVVFSSSSSSEDIKRAYDSRANCYVTKPHDLDEFFAAIHRIEEFWLNLAQLPG